MYYLVWNSWLVNWIYLSRNEVDLLIQILVICIQEIYHIEYAAK